MRGHDRPLRDPDVQWRALEDGGVLVRSGDQRRFAVDEIGLVLWDRCDGDHAVDDLVAVIVHLFDVDAARATADVADFLDHLERESLVQVGDGPRETRPGKLPVDDEVLI